MTATDHDSRLALLQAIGEVADAPLPLSDAVSRLLDTVVPAFADLAFLDALGAGGELERLGVRAGAGGIAAAEGALLKHSRPAGSSLGITSTLTTGRSQLISPVADAELSLLAGEPGDLELLRSLRLGAVLVVPLRSRGRTLGVLACAVGLSGRSYSESDLRYAELLADRMGLALDNAGLSEMVSSLEQQMRAMLVNLAEAVLVRDARGSAVFANQAAAELLGFDSIEAVFRRSAPGQLMELYEVFDEQGAPLGVDDLPSARAARGEAAAPMLVRSVARASGRERWLLHKASAVRDESGEVALVVNIIEDLTEVKRRELAQRLLAETGRALSSSLDYQLTLRRVAELAVPGFADWCGVRVRGAGDALEQVAVAHVDPERVALAREFGERYPSRLSDDGGVAAVIRSGRSLLVRELDEELLAARATDSQREIVRELGMRSVIIVPLTVAGGEPMGVISLVRGDSGRLFEEDDLILAEELGRRAGTAVQNARLYTERSHIAETLQRSLLPPALPELPGFDLAALYLAAGDQNEVGGDFYDVFRIEDGWGLIIGDVAGRGADAAALTGLSRYTLRTAAQLLGDPAAALRQLDRELRARDQVSLATACVVFVREASQPDEGGAIRIQLALAGHPPAFHVHGGRAREVEAAGPLLGGYHGCSWSAVTIMLECGDQLVLYTDGVTDALGDGERFGEERLARALSAPDRDAGETIAAVREQLAAFVRGPQFDDTAVLVLRRAPEKPAGGAEHVIELPREAAAPRLARQRLAEWMAEQPLESGVDVVKLLGTELVTNAVIHGRGKIVLRARFESRRVRVEVEDEGAGFRHDVRPRDSSEVDGRGLLIVDRMSSGWGIEPGRARVWFELDLPA